ncbi:myosin heavy chain, embryonic smooth muscle isoform [Alosa sapidissima]|uniref:myosin heavy chain, embryonic smooth muscle isoform n=1 Tax=Alosa sapidissima TaxID=34773 RepID=UPI001C0848CC|nr:myosin heavy chain, embryonic smooth muscle isoform [Alosa sapidissima]
MNSDLGELLNSNLLLPSMHLCLEGLHMYQRAGLFCPSMPGHPAATCKSLLCHGASMERQAACRQLKPDLAASFKPCGILGRTSSQETLELLHHLLGVSERLQKEACSSTGEAEWPGACSQSTRGPDWEAPWQDNRSPSAESDLQGEGSRRCLSPASSLRPADGDGDHLAARLMAPQVLCGDGQSEEEQTRTSTANLRWFSASKRRASLKAAKEKQQGDVRAQQQQQGDVRAQQQQQGDVRAQQQQGDVRAQQQQGDVRAQQQQQGDVRAQQREVEVLLQQRDKQTNRAVQFLLMKQQDALEVSSLVKLREAEGIRLQEMLRMEQGRSAQLAAGFERVCEVLKSKLSLTESGNESLAGQLRALLEKYARLRKRATAAKRRLQGEVKDKEQIQRRLEETKRELEETKRELEETKRELEETKRELEAKQKRELEAKQKRELEETKRELEERDAALAELEDSRRKLQRAQEWREGVVREKLALEEEASALRSAVGRLTQQLGKSQRESKRLAKSVRSSDQEREASLKTLGELQDTVRSLHTKLEESGVERQAVMDQAEALKQEAESRHNRQRVEVLRLQEEHKGCVEREESLRREAGALVKLVSDLKQDKAELREEAEALRREAGRAERLRDAVGTLENERLLLLAEMEVLRQDYVALSDRIAQRMAQLEQDEPMSAGEMAPVRQASAQQSDLEHTSATGSVATQDVIMQIRKKLQAEELVSRKS